MSSPNDLINKVGSLSSLPDSYHRVDAAVSDSSGSARDIAEAIEMDQSMSARVLRLANSSMYAFPARVDTITRAVTIIGTKQIKDLALATCILDMFDGLEDESLDAKGFWHGAFATGCLARILSVKSREQNPERFFVCGMLATLGRLIMVQAERETFVAARHKNAAGMLMHHAEEELFGFSQAAVTRALLEQWKLPRTMSESLSHIYGDVVQCTHPQEPAIIHVAHALCATYLLGNSGESLAIPIDPEAWKLAGPELDSLDELMTQVENLATDLAGVMQ